MPLFMPDEELAALASDAASMVAERADEYIRNELDDRRSESEKCLLIFQDCGLTLAKVRSSFEQSIAEAEAGLALSKDLIKASQAALADHKLASQAEKRQLMELLEEKDAEISEKNSTIKTIKSCLDKMMSEELCTAKEEIDKLRGEIVQYKSIAQVNETALKQMESAHENFRQEAEKKQRSLEAEIVALTERVSELAND